MFFWIVGTFVVLAIALYFVYAVLYSFAFSRAVRAYHSQFDQDGEGEKLVIRTDGLFPVLGEKPPENAMWRVKTGMYYANNALVVTYRYDPDQLDNADLDFPENIEAEIRQMEAEGRHIMDAQKLK